jgi:hypothetical protein
MKIKEDGDREKSTVHVNIQTIIYWQLCVLVAFDFQYSDFERYHFTPIILYELKQQLEKGKRNQTPSER